MAPVACQGSDLAKFRSNGRFIVTQGKEFWKDGELNFPDFGPVSRSVDKSYRSLLGPCVALDAWVYENCDSGMKYAFRRLTAAREPSSSRLAMLDPKTTDKDEFIENYDAMLRKNQDANVPALYDLLENISSTYESTDQDIFSTIEEAAEEFHDNPHAKRVLRIQAWREMNESGARHHKLWLAEVLYKFKKDEIAKFGKKPRSIGDLGVAASLQGFICTSLLKKAMAKHPITNNGMTAEFIKSPKPEALSGAFSQLLDPVGRGYMCYFSDDSCISIVINGVKRKFNVDISGCDSSHGDKIFEALIRIAPKALRPAFRILVEQLKLPVVIRSQHGHAKVRGHFTGPTLFSGSTATTVTNNVANVLIFLILSSLTFEDRHYSASELSSVFTHALESIGYVVTGFSEKEECHRPEDLQFLKHSLALDVNGVYRPLLNHGVFLRSQGSCHGDVPGGSKRFSIVQRCASFQLSLIRGMFPRTSAPIITRLLAAAQRNAHPDLSHVCDEIVAKQLEYKVDQGDQTYYFTDEALLARYNLTAEDLFAAQEFADAGPYEHTAAPFASKILQADYQIGTLTWKNKCIKDGTWMT